MNGKYTERLKTGGDLIITVNDWYIQYYFSGPDLRYNGTFVQVAGEEIIADYQYAKQRAKVLQNMLKSL